MKKLEELTALFEQRRNEAVLSYQTEREKLETDHSRKIAEWTHFITLAPKIVEALEQLHLGVAEWNYNGSITALPISDKFRFSTAREYDYDALKKRSEKMASKIERAVDEKLTVKINPFSLHSKNGEPRQVIINVRLTTAPTSPTQPE